MKGRVTAHSWTVQCPDNIFSTFISGFTWDISQPYTLHYYAHLRYQSQSQSQDRQRADPGPHQGVERRHVQLYPHQKGGGRHHPLGCGAHVDILPVHDQRGPPEDPDRDADHHLQEDIRQHGHPVEVSVVI